MSNKSSIACLFKFEGLNILLLGDSDPEEIVESLAKLGYSKNNKLKVEFVKLRIMRADIIQAMNLFKYWIAAII